MFTGAAILAWLSSFAGGVVVKLVIDGLTAWLAQRQSDANAKQVGRLETINQINTQTMETQDAIDSVPRPSDDAIADRLRSGKF